MNHMSPLVINTDSVDKTRQLAARFAEGLQAGDVISLIGDLGAGKTHFVQGIAAAVGVERDFVNSPTFVLIQEYEGTLPVCHIDAYRLADCDEFLELGADELLGGDAVCLIEWADRVADVLPRDSITVRIDVTGETTRRFTFTAAGPRGKQVLKTLRGAVEAD